MTLFSGALGFATPWLLWGLIALPAIWLLLRILPPAPVLRRFPGVVLLFGLADEDSAAARTPWPLMLLRMLAVAAAILGFAGPVLNPEVRAAGQGPLLLIADADWADAADWAARQERLTRALAEARRAGRPVAFVNLAAATPPAPAFTDGAALEPLLAALTPNPWEADATRLALVAATLPEGPFETLWLSDGLDRPGRGELLAALQAHGSVTVLQGARGVLALAPAVLKDGRITARLLHPSGQAPATAEVQAIGLDPMGAERELTRQAVAPKPGTTATELTLDLPAELRNRVLRLQIAGESSAGAVTLADDALKRRKVALISSAAPQEGLELLSPLHYLRRALAPSADLIEGTLAEVLPAAPQVIILADVAHLPAEDADALADWVDEGGLLVRFAGPRLAAAVGLDGMTDPLLPVTLRPGGRSLGGTMSWGAPRRLAPFAEGSPFQGLAIPDEVTVASQVLAEPSPDLADHTIAALDDGTPLVTRATVGEGQIVLFHVTANAEWSGLPLSGLFVGMLDRLAVSSLPGRPGKRELAGTVWVPRRVMDGFGVLSAVDGVKGVPGERLASGGAAPDMPPGLYAMDGRALALNVITADRTLTPAVWPPSVVVEGVVRPAERRLRDVILSGVILLLLADVIATLLLSGRLVRTGRKATVAVLALALSLSAPPEARADEAELRLAEAAHGMVLGHVLTGDARVDAAAKAGLAGLSQVLTERTSVEPGAPLAVDLERDDLTVLTFLYWPVAAEEPQPSVTAYRKLNQFLKTGGMILFDTRDADFATGGQTTPEGRRLQELAAGLDIPPLEVIPEDHVLTRSFYLLTDFPGRFTARAVWAEAAAPDAEKAEGVPFRNLNDGVSPVVIGGNDWASAWAVDDAGQPLYRIGRGMAGDRQREMAYRFGINLVMYVLTGNYKSDQVHVPALLERLGQ